MLVKIYGINIIVFFIDGDKELNGNKQYTLKDEDTYVIFLEYDMKKEKFSPLFYNNQIPFPISNIKKMEETVKLKKEVESKTNKRNKSESQTQKGHVSNTSPIANRTRSHRKKEEEDKTPQVSEQNVESSASLSSLSSS